MSARSRAEQLVERERFDEVVVGAEVEARDAIVDLIARGDDEDAGAEPPRTQPPQDRQTVELGHHEIEHERVVGVRLGEPQPFVAVAGRVDGVARLAQALRERSRERLVILDEQDTHPSRVSRIGGTTGTASRLTLILLSSGSHLAGLEVVR